MYENAKSKNVNLLHVVNGNPTITSYSSEVSAVTSVAAAAAVEIPTSTIERVRALLTLNKCDFKNNHSNKIIFHAHQTYDVIR